MAGRLVTFEHLGGDRTINEFELAARVGQLWLMSPWALLWSHLYNDCNNASTTGWVAGGSISRAGSKAGLLQQQALILRQHEQSYTLSYLAVKCNLLADDATHLWHLTVSVLQDHLEMHYPQVRSWRLCQPPLVAKLWILTALRYGRSGTERPALRVPTIPYDVSRPASAHGLASHPT